MNNYTFVYIYTIINTNSFRNLHRTKNAQTQGSVWDISQCFWWLCLLLSADLFNTAGNVITNSRYIKPSGLTCSWQNEEDDGPDVEGVMIGDTHLLVLPQGRMETWSLTASAASRHHLYLQLLLMTETVCQHTCAEEGRCYDHAKTSVRYDLLSLFPTLLLHT